MTATHETRLATTAMGARWELLLRGEASHARAAGEACVETIESLHARWTRFEPSSVVSGINRAGGGWTRVDRETLDAITSAEAWRERTGDAFSVARDDAGRAVHVEIEGSLVCIPADASIDLGGIAKGAALDACTEILDEAELDAALIHGGTSAVLAIGGPWSVRPADADGTPGPTLELREQVLCVSCSHPHHRDATHVDDRRTGEPASDRNVSAIVGDLGRGADADALATALCVLGVADAALAPSNNLCAHVWSSGVWRATPPKGTP